jgi:4-amino-4-deoxy-L-arabinose transferase-like glycosyltransferase
MMPRLEDTPRRLAILALFAALLVTSLVYFATLYPDHVWGDDYAQYINQAKLLTEGRSMLDTGYIYSRYDAVIGPVAYPAGFPLLLAPVYAAFGLNIQAYLVYIIIWHLLALVFIYLLFLRRVSLPTVLLLILMMGLSPYVVAFKRLVMSDAPFTLLCIAFLWWVDRLPRESKTPWRDAGVAALIVLAAFLIRTVGFVLIAALWMVDLLRYRRLTRFTLITTGISIVLVLLSRLIFGSSSDSYFDQFANYSLEHILATFQHYWVSMMNAFWAGPSLRMGGLAFPYIWLAAIPLVFIGFIAACRRQFSVIECFFVLYNLVILLWPSWQELRFLYPVLPLFLLYAALGFRDVVELVQRWLPTRLIRLGVVGVVGLIGVIYGVRSLETIQTETRYPEGPYTQPAQEMLDFIRAETPADAVIMFYKPRALALYTGRSAAAFPSQESPEVALAWLQETNARYIVVDLDDDPAYTTNERLLDFIAARPAAFTRLLENEGYLIFQINPDELASTHPTST